jgi:PAS domain S-box-containing protein
MKDSLCLLDASGNIVFCNPSAELLLGPKETCVGHPLFWLPWKLIKQDGQPYPQAALSAARTLQTAKSFEMTVGAKRGGAELRWLTVTFLPMRLSGAKAVSMTLVTLREITDEKRDRDLLSQREAYYRSLIEHSYDIITVLDMDGAICFESPSVHRLLGYRPQELSGLKAVDYIHPEDRPQALAAFRDRLAHPTESQSIICRVRHMNGTWVTLETVSTLQQSSLGRSRIILNSRASH